ncbi:MAG TPA: potassium-transporting ATPase subunit KdpA [Gemmataceae bacterium]|nr:potassium-transporting ATPase subunit KdpA [Gemmataceae bacterium]
MWTFAAVVVLLLVGLSFPLGCCLEWIIDGRYAPPRWLAWLERRIDTGPQNWRQYAFSLILFSTLLFAVGYLFLCLQPWAPANPDGKSALAPCTIFNIVISFQSNTSLQHYSGEQHLSYFSQIAVIVWLMFASGSVGFGALAAVIRGLRGDSHMGNFYLDVWRGLVYVFLPISLILAVAFVAAGVPMTFGAAAIVHPLDGGEQTICRGPVAVLEPVKHLASVGGGFFGASSAHPFENPNAWTNCVECVAILLLPCAQVILFGRMLRQMRHALVLYGVMLVLLVTVIGWAVRWDAGKPNPGLTGTKHTVYNEDDSAKRLELAEAPPLPVNQSSGNLEGKELRLGAPASAVFVAVTAAGDCGSVDCMHDSLDPLALLSAFVGMWLNCIFGGKGVGLINLLLYLILAVFLGGLMVGRTPEYLGRKVEAREMKLAMLALLVHPIIILAPTALFAVLSWGPQSTGNPGPHGFAEILYEFSSSASNNGSELSGLHQTSGLDAIDPQSPPAPYSPQWDTATGVVMLFGRFLSIIAALALAGSLSVKPAIPVTVGTLRTDTLTFGFFLLGVVLVVGALLFLPGAVLTTAAEHYGPMPFGK